MLAATRTSMADMLRACFRPSAVLLLARGLIHGHDPLIDILIARFGWLRRGHHGGAVRTALAIVGSSGRRRVGDVR
jgi:uncharacterized membrane protein YqaE (UPF0057 family)